MDNNNITFDEIVSYFLEYKKITVKASTLSNYKFCITHRLFPKLKGKSIAELRNYNFNKLTSYLSETLSNKTVRDTVVLLREILRYANKKYKADFEIELISIPKLQKKSVEIFNNEDRVKLEKWLLKDNDIRCLGILFSLYAGLRIGEVCGLKWKNIDIENSLISIDSTVERIYVEENKTGIIIDNPKTNSSIRKIPLATKLKNKIKELKNKYSNESFILTGLENKFFEPIVYRVYYKQLLEDLGIKYKNYHTLRHTFATRCVIEGIDIKSLSEILGHSNVNTTLNIYVHSSFEIKKKFINKL